MKRFAKLFTVFFITFTILTMAFVIVKKRKAELAKLPSVPPTYVPVRVARIKRGTLLVTEHYLGEVWPVVFSTISSRISSFLFDVKKFEGDKVKKGELIAVLDSREIESRIRGIKSKIFAAQSECVIKKRILERNRILFKNKALSEEAWELSQLDYERAKANLEFLKEELAALKAELSYARIVAPFKGVVTKRFKNPGDFVVSGTPILELEKTGEGYKVLVSIPQEKAALMKTGEKVILRGRGKSIPSRIFRIHPAVYNDGLAKLEVRLSQRPFGLPTGSKIGVDVVVKKVSGFLLPLNALFETNARTWVFAVSKAISKNKSFSEVKAVSVRVLGRSENQVAVSGPLSEYEEVVVATEATFLRMYSGAKVKVIRVSEE